MKAIFTLLFILSPLFTFGGGVIDKEKAKERKKVTKMGVKLDAASRIMLNQYFKSKKLKDKSYYSIEFYCEHQKGAKEDICHFNEVNYKKNKKR